MAKKYLSLDQNILLEWEYDSINISENYTIWSDLSKKTRNFLSTTNINNIFHNLFVVDPVLKKYSKIDTSKFNFLKTQNYSTPPISYDKITLYFPSNYDFGVYLGFYLKILSFDYFNRDKYPLSNFYFDKSQAQNINDEIEYSDKLMNLGSPFIYNQKEWGKYITYYVPSVHEVSNQRESEINKVIPNGINSNLTDSIGLSLSSPIYLEFSFITSKDFVFGVPYYYMGDTYKASISTQPEYQTLGVMIEESKQGDFFDIYGVYDNSNQNLDNFVNELESKGRRINVEYTVTLYEENLISGFPITFLITENFSQKIEYRPIIKYSNTTASIDVEMKIIDLVDNSYFSRNASIGLTKNLLKYGKKLTRINVDNLTKPKIYNYKYDKVYDLKTTSNKTNIDIIKVPFPILINNYKILANNYNTVSSSDYKGMGLLNIILTPFDNIIKFQIAKQNSINEPIVPYNLSEILLNSKLNLVFKSDSRTIMKEIYYQTDENRFEIGVVVFKVNQEDISVLKQMVKEKSDNFYIILNSNNSKTLLYSGKFKIFENIKFLEVKSKTTTTGSTSDISLIEDTPSNIMRTEGGLNDIVPPQFDADGIPLLEPDARGTLDSYKNLIVWVKSGLTNKQLSKVIDNLNNIGVIINYAYPPFIYEQSQSITSGGSINQSSQSSQTNNSSINDAILTQQQTIILLERVPVSKLSNIVKIPNVINAKAISLDFGWKKSTDKTINFNAFGNAQLNPDIIKNMEDNISGVL